MTKAHLGLMSWISGS